MICYADHAGRMVCDRKMNHSPVLLRKEHEDEAGGR